MISTSFRARLYGPDLPVAGVDVEAFFSPYILQISGLASTGISDKLSTLTVQIDQISASAGGFEHQDLFLEWQDAAGLAWSLKTATAADTAMVMAQAPDALQAQFNVWRSRRRRIRIVWGSIVSVALSVMMAIALVWFFYDETVSWVANQVPIKTEERMGNYVLKQIESEGNMVKEGTAVTAINQIGARLTQGSAYRYRWLIKRDDSVNAFALPGGIVIVNSGLIQKVDSTEELAAVLAHEVQHVEQRHSLQSAIHSVGWAAGLMMVLGDVNVATAVIVHQLGNMYFSRDKEDQADRAGYELLVRKKIQPHGMASFFKKMQKIYPDGSPAWLSSHPDLDARLKGIEKLMRDQPCSDCKPLGLDIKKIQQDKQLISDEKISSTRSQ
jgi:beta-barrel assembly-enhancing protease